MHNIYVKILLTYEDLQMSHLFHYQIMHNAKFVM
jgi:hypothetical protein